MFHLSIRVLHSYHLRRYNLLYLLFANFYESIDLLLDIKGDQFSNQIVLFALRTLKKKTHILYEINEVKIILSCNCNHNLQEDGVI